MGTAFLLLTSTRTCTYNFVLLKVIINFIQYLWVFVLILIKVSVIDSKHDCISLVFSHRNRENLRNTRICLVSLKSSYIENYLLNPCIELNKKYILQGKGQPGINGNSEGITFKLNMYDKKNTINNGLTKVKDQDSIYSSG